MLTSSCEWQSASPSGVAAKATDGLRAHNSNTQILTFEREAEAGPSAPLSEAGPEVFSDFEKWFPWPSFHRFCIWRKGSLSVKTQGQKKKLNHQVLLSPPGYCHEVLLSTPVCHHEVLPLCPVFLRGYPLHYGI